VDCLCERVVLLPPPRFLQAITPASNRRLRNSGDTWFSNGHLHVTRPTHLGARTFGMQLRCGPAPQESGSGSAGPTGGMPGA
jgi:hypothetical protein